jgi:mRNA interferase MazF
MGMAISQYDIFLINLDPTVGHEIKKTRPCVVVSPDEMNKHIKTVIIAPMTTKGKNYPTRIKVEFRKKNGWIVLDQIRTVDKKRLVKRLGNLERKTTIKVKETFREMLVD